MDQSVQNAEKKKSKLKEFEEAVGAKLEAKKAEIVELKGAHGKELASLQKTIEEQKEKVILEFNFFQKSSYSCSDIQFLYRTIQAAIKGATNGI